MHSILAVERKRKQRWAIIKPQIKSYESQTIGAKSLKCLVCSCIKVVAGEANKRQIKHVSLYYCWENDSYSVFQYSIGMYRHLIDLISNRLGNHAEPYGEW